MGADGEGGEAGMGGLFGESLVEVFCVAEEDADEVGEDGDAAGHGPVRRGRWLVGRCGVWRRRCMGGVLTLFVSLYRGGRLLGVLP